MRNFYLIKIIAILVTLALGAIAPAEAQVNEDEYDLEISGVVEEISVDSIVVSGITILITEATILPDDLEVRHEVDVYVEYTDDEFTAVELELEDETDDDDHDVENPDATEEPSNNDDDGDDEKDNVKFTGTLDEIGIDYIVLSGVTIHLRDVTEISDDLVVGEIYEVYIELDDDTFTADEIELHNEDEDDEDRGEIDDDDDSDDDDDVSNDDDNDHDDDHDEDDDSDDHDDSRNGDNDDDHDGDDDDHDDDSRNGDDHDDDDDHDDHDDHDDDD
jgi:hypothetical protein